MRHYRLVHSDLSTSLTTHLALRITSVFTGYIGTDSIGSLLSNASLLKSRSRRWQKSIINARRSLICWRGRRELDNDAETRNHGYDVIVGGELFTDYSDHPRKLVTAKPKTQSSTGAGRYQLLSCVVMPTASSLA